MLSYKILIAEDDEFTAEIISKTLDTLGFEHRVVSNGEEALKEIAYDFYDLILMDVLMPKLNGIETSIAIRKISNTTPIIAFTSCNFQDIESDLKKAGINEYLAKPTELENLPNQLLNYFKRVA